MDEDISADDGLTADGASPSLADMPDNVLTVIFAHASSVYDIGCCACVSRDFQLIVEQSLRLRSTERGELLQHDDPLPAGEKTWMQLLFWRERRHTPPMAVAAGQMHSCFVSAGGVLLTSGSDVLGRGLLGQGHYRTSSETPAPVLLIPERITAVAAHHMHTLALAASGAVYSFGNGECGKLGHGDEAPQFAPRQIEGLDEATQVVLGQQHSLVLTCSGKVFSFGSGTHPPTRPTAWCLPQRLLS